MKTSLSLLDGIQVASPCTASWDEMVGDEHARYCGHCEKNVFNLSALTTDAAISLIKEHEGKLCGRFFRRADGTILTADCPVGVHHRIQRKKRLAVFAASFAGLLSLSGCTRFDDTSTDSKVDATIKQTKVEKAVMGDVCLPNPKPGVKKDDMIMGKIDDRGLFCPEKSPSATPTDQLPPPREVVGE